MASIKVRFNLGRGANYMKWKVSFPDGNTEYYSPTDVQLVLNNCQIKNYKSAAKKIFEGGTKVVCAWILCEDITIRTDGFNQSDVKGQRLRYNPRIDPNWVTDGINVDNMKFNRIESVDYGLYIMY